MSALREYREILPNEFKWRGRLGRWNITQCGFYKHETKIANNEEIANSLMTTKTTRTQQ